MTAPAVIVPRRWQIRIPAPHRIVSYNHDQGRGANAHRKAWRDTAFARIGDGHVPTGLTRVRIDIEIRFPTAARRDEANYHPTVAKPIVDAIGPERRRRLSDGRTVLMRGRGIIADDSNKFVHCTDCPHITFGEPIGRADPRWPFGYVILTITDLSQEAS